MDGADLPFHLLFLSLLMTRFVDMGMRSESTFCTIDPFCWWINSKWLTCRINILFNTSGLEPQLHQTSVRPYSVAGILYAIGFGMIANIWACWLWRASRREMRQVPCMTGGFQSIHYWENVKTSPKLCKLFVRRISYSIGLSLLRLVLQVSPKRG